MTLSFHTFFFLTERHFLEGEDLPLFRIEPIKLQNSLISSRVNVGAAFYGKLSNMSGGIKLFAS